MKSDSSDEPDEADTLTIYSLDDSKSVIELVTDASIPLTRLNSKKSQNFHFYA